jgi:diguanylate cyclase (GGDEF)-like protein/putative nucleotidyltransferase with HDIG domain
MPITRRMMTRPRTVIDGLLEVMSATSQQDCVAKIELQLERLFPEVAPTLVVGDCDDPRADDVVLCARGCVHGRIRMVNLEQLDDEQLAELEAFADHAALALDNARLLEDHERRARRDPLTGLLNHGEFHTYLARAIAEVDTDPGRSVTLVVFDLDHFKLVNDEAGHAAGDRLLRSVAAALTAACRSTDAAFRIGGDEFALLLRGASRDDADAIAARASAAISRLDGSVGASWGVATMPTEATTRERLLALADENMYERKGRRDNSAPPVLRRYDAASRLEVAARLAVRLTDLRDPVEIARAVVIHRLDDDGHLRALAAAGRLADAHHNFVAWEQSINAGVNGRVARSGTQVLVNDTRLDPDYLQVNPGDDPGSELCTPIVVDGRIWGVLNLEQLATHSFEDYDMMLSEAVVAQTGAAIHRCELLHEMEHSFSTTLGVLCDVLETKDAYTADHAVEVATLAESTANQLGMPEGRRRALRYCGLLHDIGKIGIRTEILNKPSALTDSEYLEIQEHSAMGAAILGRIPLLTDIAPLVRAVHERWDGQGYPDRLLGTQIPLEARIVAVCDAWHAMIFDRPYRRALSRADALAELTRSSGSQFDPTVVRAFIKTVEA